MPAGRRRARLPEEEAREAVRALTTASAFKTLETFVSLCEAWSAVSNLVGAADRGRLWSRHVLDSLQLVPLAASAGPHWIDLGSGGGFPGMVAAIAREGTVTLVESNRKKAAFLLQAAVACSAPVKVEPRRIQDLDAKPYDVVSARALAPLTALLGLSARFYGTETLGLYPKGREAATELDAAREAYRFDAQLHPSRTDPSAAIVAVTNLGGHNAARTT